VNIPGLNLNTSSQSGTKTDPPKSQGEGQTTGQQSGILD
jgi:hypothetical protein